MMGGLDSSAAIAGYTMHAEELIPRYDAIPSEIWYAPVRRLIPSMPVRVIDIGAGTGCDARWFAAMGHQVTAVEPVPAFVAAGQSKGAERWVTDTLPHLHQTLTLNERFDLLILSGVWQHLNSFERLLAAPNIHRLAAPNSTILMALRHGPGPTDRPVWPIDPDATVALFAELGCTETIRVHTPSIQAENRATGVHWTWIALTT